MTHKFSIGQPVYIRDEIPVRFYRVEELPDQPCGYYVLQHRDGFRRYQPEEMLVRMRLNLQDKLAKGKYMTSRTYVNAKPTDTVSKLMQVIMAEKEADNDALKACCSLFRVVVNKNLLTE